MKETHVKLDRLSQYLQNSPAYIQAMEEVCKTAASCGVSEEALKKILDAYQNVEQIRADFLCDIGFPVKEKHLTYGSVHYTDLM